MAHVPNVSSEVLDNLLLPSGAKGRGPGEDGFESALREASGGRRAENSPADQASKPRGTEEREGAKEASSGEEVKAREGDEKAEEKKADGSSTEGAGEAKSEKTADAPSSEGGKGADAPSSGQKTPALAADATAEGAPTKLQAFVALVSGGHAEPRGQGEGPDFAAHPVVTGRAPASSSGGDAPPDQTQAAGPAAGPAQGTPVPDALSEGAGEVLQGQDPPAPAKGSATAGKAQDLLARGGLPAAASEGHPTGEGSRAPGAAVSKAAQEILAGAKLPYEEGVPGPAEGDDPEVAAPGPKGAAENPPKVQNSNGGLTSLLGAEAAEEGEAGEAKRWSLGGRLGEIAVPRGPRAEAQPAPNGTLETLAPEGDFGRARGEGELEAASAKQVPVGRSGGAGEAARADGPSTESAAASVERFDAFLRIQVQRQILEAAMARMRLAVRDGVAHARLRLEPPALGRVDMELRVETGTLHAKVTVENAWVRDTVMSNLRTLREALQDHGVNVDQFTVDVNANLGAGNFGGEPAGGEAEGALFLEAVPDEAASELAGAGESIPAAGAGGVGADGSVNIFA